MKLFKYILIGPLFLIFALTACDSTEGEGGGGLQPGAGEPYVVDGFICGGIYEGSPVAIDNDFFQDDEVYVWLSWANVEGEHTVEIVWLDPDVEMVAETSDEFDSDTGKRINYFFIDTSDNAPVGQWLAEVYIDDIFVRSYAFWMLED